MEWHIIGVLVILALMFYYRYRQEEDNNTEIYQEANQLDNYNNCDSMEETISTRQLALNTIESIGSEPQYTEDGRIQFEYQSVIFLIEATNECLFVNLIWPWCHSFSKFDIDEFARVRQVVNKVNLQETVSVVYTISDSDDVALHIKKNFLFVPQIPQIENYLKLILNGFFRTARTLELEIEKCRLQECEKNI